MSDGSLLVFAHSDEAEAFAQAGVPHLITGVGKINATLGLGKAIFGSRAAGRPVDRAVDRHVDGVVDRVVVLGTAGALSDEAKLDTVYQIDRVVQHDFSLPSPTLKLSGPMLTTDTAVIATGDVFVQNDAQRAALARLGATLVDMETYAYATVCERLEVPLQVFKVPSDFADSTTSQEEWDAVAVSKSEQLLAFVRRKLPELLA